MKVEKIRGIDQAEMKTKIADAQEQLFRIRFQMRMGQQDGIKKYRELKKDIARMMGVQRERALASEGS